MNTKTIFSTLSILLTLLSQPLSAKVSQAIDRTEIGAGETFMLNIQVESNSNADLDLSMIPKEITIVSNSQYQNISFVNGKRTSVKGWKLKLKTLKAGILNFPALQIGNETTKAFQLNIKSSSHQIKINGQDKAIFLTAEVDQSNPYVQQQVIYTMSLYRSVATHYENLSTPVIDNAIFEQLGEDKVFDKIIDNRRYTVFQRKYVVFPQQSGTLKVDAISFSAEVNDNNARQSYFSNSTRPISISSEPIIINVKPKPSSVKETWLPAEYVKLSSHWSSNDALTVGEPATWTISLTVQGLSESQLPEIKMPSIKGLQLYPDTPKKSQQINSNGILSQRVEKFAVIPSATGNVTIPAITLTWWDTQKNMQQVAKIPAKIFNVLASTNPKTSFTIPQLPLAEKPLSLDSKTTSQEIKQWQLLAGVLLILWLMTLFAYFKKPAIGVKKKQMGQKNLKDQTQTSNKQLLKTVQQALTTQDLDIIEKSLLTMASSISAKTYYSLGSLAADLGDPTLQSKVIALEKLRYSASQQSNLDELENSDLIEIYNTLSNKSEPLSALEIPALYSHQAKN